MNESSYLSLAAIWVALVAEANTTLESKAFAFWLMAVGVNGSDESRIEKGRGLLPIFVNQEKETK